MNTIIAAALLAASLVVPFGKTAEVKTAAPSEVTVKAEPKILTLGELSQDPSGKAMLLGHEVKGDTVVYHMKTEEKAGEPNVTRIDDPTLEEGKEVFVQEGSLGKVEVKYDIITDFEGNRLDTVQISRIVIEGPKDSIIKVGTKKN